MTPPLYLHLISGHSCCSSCNLFSDRVSCLKLVLHQVLHLRDISIAQLNKSKWKKKLSKGWHRCEAYPTFIMIMVEYNGLYIDIYAYHILTVCLSGKMWINTLGWKSHKESSTVTCITSLLMNPKQHFVFKFWNSLPNVGKEVTCEYKHQK